MSDSDTRRDGLGKQGEVRWNVGGQRQMDTVCVRVRVCVCPHGGRSCMCTCRDSVCALGTDPECARVCEIQSREHMEYVQQTVQLMM